MCFEAFFPDLVAGPIIRYAAMEEQMRVRQHTWEKFARGVAFFALGMAKKILIANPMGHVADTAFGAGALHAHDAWFGIFGYAFQIYFDFSGYSDMAAGLALMMGFVLIQNFDSPYKADSITDFWRRWHISLSTWLRDYLYIPLGGSRQGSVRANRNLIVTMLLGGLWHGANWTFVVWGLYHGVLLVANRALSRRQIAWPAGAARAATFVLVVAGWVIFRSTDMRMASVWLARMAGVGGGTDAPPAALVWWVVACLGLANAAPEPREWRLGWSRPWIFAYAVLFFVAYLSMNGHDAPFLYYQF
jgi:alginate O-acetyltransferase complex protein AlgI